VVNDNPCQGSRYREKCRKRGRVQVDLRTLTVDANRFWRGESTYRGDLAFIDLAATAAWPNDLSLPQCPVIGIGPREHPFGALLDAVIERPVRAEALAEQVLAQPHAAAVAAQLLRMLPNLGLDDGLTAESFAYGLLQGSGAHRQWLAGRGEAASPAHGGGVRVERSDGRLTITLDQPETGNAIDRPMRDALYDAFTIAALDPGIHKVRLCATGRIFSLGAELAEFGTTADPATAHAIRFQTLPARMIAQCAERLQVDVQGACVGAGLEMAAWARYVTATPKAWFQLPELAMGILPGASGCVSLSRRIGRQRAALLILSGKRIGARTALDWGLVDEIVEEPA
jgi:enoyl-CoA hydratase